MNNIFFSHYNEEYDVKVIEVNPRKLNLQCHAIISNFFKTIFKDQVSPIFFAIPWCDQTGSKLAEN